MIYKYVFSCLMLSLCLASCQQDIPLNNISVQQVHVIQQTTNNPYTIIDVRTPEEFEKGHINSAINIDVKSDRFSTEVEKLNPSKNYILYCRSGKRSAKAYKIMTDLNFKNLINMEGGYLKYKADILNK